MTPCNRVENSSTRGCGVGLTPGIRVHLPFRWPFCRVHGTLAPLARPLHRSQIHAAAKNLCTNATCSSVFSAGA